MTLSFCYKYAPCASSEMYQVLIVLEYKLFLFFSAPLSLSSECYSLENTRFVFLFFQEVPVEDFKRRKRSLSRTLPFFWPLLHSVSVRLILSPSVGRHVQYSPFSKSKAEEIELLNYAPYPFPGGDNTGPLDDKVMKFIVLPGSPKPSDTSVIPPKLVSYSPALLKHVTKTRYIALYEEISNITGAPIHMYINGLTLLDPVTETPKSGTTELWNVINLTADNHPLHIHSASLQAIKVQNLAELETFVEFEECKEEDKEKRSRGKRAAQRRLILVSNTRSIH